MFVQNDTLQCYMRRINTYPLITPQEEIELAAGIRRGNDDARDRLVSSNLRLVVKIAHDFKGRGLPLIDLISEGNIGLMRAVGKFDPTKGAKLSSYAAWWIKQSMRRAIANQVHTVRVPIQSAAKLRKMQVVRAELKRRLQRDPTDLELAVESGLPEYTVSRLKMVSTTTLSFQDPVQNDGDREFSEVIADTTAMSPDKVAESDDSLRRILELVDRLDDRERAILKLRFGLDDGRKRTLDEVSEVVGCTRERVRQIQNATLRRLRQMLSDEKPEPEAAA